MASSASKPLSKEAKVQLTRKSAAMTAIAASAYGVGNEIRGNDMEWYWTIYQRHPWVGLCVDLIAESVASEGYSIIPIEGETNNPIGTDTTRVSQIISFLRNAFINSTFTRALLATAVDLRVYNVSYWRKIRVGKLQVGYERIDPRTVSRRIARGGTTISEFVIRQIDNGGLILTEDAKIIQPADMTMFTMGGGDPVFGAPSPLERLDLTVATDWQIRRYREAFFRNGAVAGRVLINKEGHEDDVKAALAMVRSTQTGAENAFKTAVITGDWQVFEKAASGDNDVDFVKGTIMARDEVFAVYKVPVGKMFSDSKGALGQAGKKADDDTFQRDAVLPVERVIYETLTLDWLHTEIGWNDLEIIPKRLNQIRLDRFDAAESVVKFGGTGNEARAIANFPSIDDPGMNVPLFLGQHQPLVAEEDGSGNEPAEETSTTDDSADENKSKTSKQPAPPTVNKQQNSPDAQASTTTTPSKPKKTTSNLPTTARGAKQRG